MISYEQYLRESAVPKETLDVFLDPSRRSWAEFDPELGYTLGNSLQGKGLDGSVTVTTARLARARTPHVYAGAPPRINTYGNSFTECHQVSDAETWQEYLAGHLCEPVGNHGVGGYGLYQAYRRMIRIESVGDGADLVLLYLFADDHCRGVMRCRHAVIRIRWDHQGGMRFHNNFWANIEYDFDSGQFAERPNPLPTPESLYKMAEPDFMAEQLKDDMMVQLFVADRVDPKTLDWERLHALADALNVPRIDPGGAPDTLKQEATRLANDYGFAAAKEVIGMANRFCRERNKKLMVLLLCPVAMDQAFRGAPRYDQTMLDYFREQELPYFDMNEFHRKDFENFSVPREQYMKRYYVGHYGPAGNHLFAYALKDQVVELLDPKPLPYRQDVQPGDFDKYLPK
jgi:hypothetical protein